MRGEGVRLGSLCSCSLTVGLVLGGGGPSLNGWVGGCQFVCHWCLAHKQRLYLDHSNDTAHFIHQTCSRGTSQLHGHVPFYLTMDFLSKYNMLI